MNTRTAITVPAARVTPALARLRIAAALCIALSAGGCATLTEYMPQIPPPSFDWLTSLFGYGSKKPGPLPEINATVNPQVIWQVSVGKAAPGFTPAITPDAIYAAVPGGTITRVDPATGASAWRIEAGMKLSAGVGADATLVVVGTNKGDVLAFDTSGKPLWQSKISSEVVGPPKVAEGTVVVWSGDGRTFGLSAADGKTKWVYQRVNPALVVRNYAGGTISRGGLFTGTAGGKLVAMDLASGNVGWEANVATPKGATELERIADVTSLPLVEERQACAVAFQGRVACFEILRGTLNWSRDVSSLTGLANDNRYVFVCDDAGAMSAFDRLTGTSAWKQDKLAQRKLGGPQLAGDFLMAVDVEGYVHLFDRSNGSLVGRTPTDGTPATSQPALAGANAVWQSVGGTLYAVTAR
jgi:outer membrane protein assembly factor BamB